MMKIHLILTLILLLIFTACDSAQQSQSSQSPEAQKTPAAGQKQPGGKGQINQPPGGKTIGPNPNNPGDPTARATAVSKAVVLLLKEKPSDSPEYQEALQLLKSTLSIRELRNNRDKRNDPTMLSNRYPKKGGLMVGVELDKPVYWTAYDRTHFVARHTIESFDTTDIKGKNSWWPAGTGPVQIDQYLQATIHQYAEQIKLPEKGRGGGFKYYDFDLPGVQGIKVQIGITSEGRVTSFFPTGGPNVINLSEEDTRKLLNIVRGEG